MSRERFLNRDKGKSAGYIRSSKQEKSLATRLNKGELVRRSGAGAEKGDVKVKGIVRIECKTTEKKSFSVTREMIRKIEEATLANGEKVGAIVVEFIDEKGNPLDEVAIVPTHFLEGLE